MAPIFYRYFNSSVKYAVHFDIIDNHIFDSENNKIVLKKPPKNVIVADAMFIDTAYLLNIKKMIKSVKGVFWADVVLKNYPIYEKYKDGEISNVGGDGITNYEKILEINPELVILIDWNIFNPLSKWLRNKNIGYVKTGNYKEPNFLGKIEWIKFYASIFGKFKKAEKIFNKIVEEKKKILTSLNRVRYKPVVAFFGYHKNRAYVYGKDHYIPHLINDLKGNYLFENVEGICYQPIDRKEFINKAKYADVCILDSMGEDVDTEKLLKENPEFLKFKAYKTGHFYITSSDYLKHETLNSIKILEEYAKILHPKIYETDDLKHFVQLL
ncbi:MAG: ABC transporter substrate-binding protein [Methanococci archaeon]|nr:ABC transporter substrate-binding protein [Methanococci archaeon]